MWVREWKCNLVERANANIKDDDVDEGKSFSFVIHANEGKSIDGVKRASMCC